MAIRGMTTFITLAALFFLSAAPAATASTFNYRDALSKSVLFFECQRSGKLPSDQRVTWRGDSALLDGSDYNVDLMGGYYDAGDNVKFGFPMAFTITVLSWGALENTDTLAAVQELDNIRIAIRWGTDYFLKASKVPTQLWVQVGNANADHQCWERPESMDTPRTSSQINASSPSTEVAAETAAALAAASLIFKDVDANYSAALLNRAATLFHFADRYRASYTAECPFYCSYSGYMDELLWAAAWLLKATGKPVYLRYIRLALNNTADASEFSWDNKFAGLAVLLSKMYFEGDHTLRLLKSRADFFMCANLPGSNITQVSRTPGGLLYVRAGANTQYAGGAAFLAAVYSRYLSQFSGVQSSMIITCGNKDYSSQEILSFAQDQVDYILGKNPLGISYMVGFGTAYPLQVHHRGASIRSTVTLSTTSAHESVQCADGFWLWFSRAAPNPNVAVGAIVGGPDQQDGFHDVRSNSEQLEPTTYINALFAGALASLVQLDTLVPNLPSRVFNYV